MTGREVSGQSQHFEQKSDPAEPVTPPRRPVRARWLLVRLALALLIAGVLTSVFWPGWLDENSRFFAGPEAYTTVYILFYFSLWVLLIGPMRRCDIRWRDLVPRLSPVAVRWVVVTTIGLIGIALAATYAVFFPLSYFSPDWVEVWLFDPSGQLVWPNLQGRRGANLIGFISVVILTPVVEEILFRGLLLRAWYDKWGRWPAILGSSTCFAVMHVDPIGAFVFAVILSMTYLYSGRLEVCIAVHVLNNLAVWLWVFGSVVLDPASAVVFEIDEFRAGWWMGAAGVVIGISLVIGSVRRIGAVFAPAPPAWGKRERR